jgi:hypothetical protein
MHSSTRHINFPLRSTRETRQFLCRALKSRALGNFRGGALEVHSSERVPVFETNGRSKRRKFSTSGNSGILVWFDSFVRSSGRPVATVLSTEVKAKLGSLFLVHLKSLVVLQFMDNSS